jgi:hypothetical protein
MAGLTYYATASAAYVPERLAEPRPSIDLPGVRDPIAFLKSTIWT